MDINSEKDLADAILTLEGKHKRDGQLLVVELNQTLQRLQPANMLKTILTEATASPELKDNLVNTSVAVATGYVTKLLFNGKKAGPLRKLVGSGLMFAVSNLISNNPEKVRLAGNAIVNIGKQLFKKEEASEVE